MAREKESKRVTSTAKNLRNMWLSRMFSSFLLFDLMAVGLLTAVFSFAVERQSLGRLNWQAQRQVSIGDGALLYSVTERNKEQQMLRKFSIQVDFAQTELRVLQTMEDGTTVMQDYAIFLRAAVFFLYAVGIYQLLALLQYWITGIFPIKKQLKPLNEISENAYKISTMAFDESKMHELEEAIGKITPTGPDGSLHTQDEDLQGIEAAINSMIDRMRESYKQQSRFVSDASHELRTPIAVIQGYVNMLDRWGKEDEKILDESIKAIKNESDHMKKLVEQLLFLARGDSGRQPMKVEEVSLYDMMKEVYEESLMIDEKHIYDFVGQEGAVIQGDLDMIKQTARILIDNAAKYTLEKDHITLNCGVNAEGKAFFSVQDNGIGMSEQDVYHVFERFYRSDDARDKKTGGTGLGLSIAKWIVDKHQGYFEVLSRKELGTRITVFFHAGKS